MANRSGLVMRNRDARVTKSPVGLSMTNQDSLEMKSRDGQVRRREDILMTKSQMMSQPHRQRDALEDLAINRPMMHRRLGHPRANRAVLGVNLRTDVALRVLVVTPLARPNLL